jgi:histidyl-tRNA synthetase
MSLQAPRGTRDILPEEAIKWQFVQELARKVAAQLSFQPITVPTYEELALFQRSIGAGTDVIDKELFLTRGIKSESESYALRPEGTAGTVRAFIEHGLHTRPQPVRLFSLVNVFRYDRPQKGRYREHVQFDLEYFGDFGPFADAWVIYTTWYFLNQLGLKGLQLKLNSLGDKEERKNFNQALVDYFTPLKEQLSADSQTRLNTNPLRILDSKVEGDRLLVDQAPKLNEFLKEASQKHFQAVQDYLLTWKIPFVLDPFLVRGLDYYKHTAFEWVVKNSGGQQNSLGGGGRYDDLLPQLGGKDIGAVGAGLGLDRIIEELDNQDQLKAISLPTPLVYVLTEKDTLKAAAELWQFLIENNLAVGANFTKESVVAQLKEAGKSGARYAIFVPSLKTGQTYILRNLENGEQVECQRQDLLPLLK